MFLRGKIIYFANATTKQKQIYCCGGRISYILLCITHDRKKSIFLQGFRMIFLPWKNNMLAGKEKTSVQTTKKIHEKIHKKIYPRGYYIRGFYLEKHSLNATLVRIAV